jgi:hypothetical protein
LDLGVDGNVSAFQVVLRDIDTTMGSMTARNIRPLKCRMPAYVLGKHPDLTYLDLKHPEFDPVGVDLVEYTQLETKHQSSIIRVA